RYEQARDISGGLTFLSVFPLCSVACILLVGWTRRRSLRHPAGLALAGPNLPAEGRIPHTPGSGVGDDHVSGVMSQQPKGSPGIRAVQDAVQETPGPRPDSPTGDRERPRVDNPVDPHGIGDP